MLNFKTVIQEALDEWMKPYVDDWERHDYKFSDHAFKSDPEGMSVTVPMIQPNKLRPKSELEPVIRKHVEDNDLGKIVDYHTNKATDKKDRHTKLTTLIKGNKDLLNQYSKDPARVESKSLDSGYHVLISRHPYHVAEQSTNQNWWSCQDLNDRMRLGYHDCVPRDLQYGTHIAYLFKNSAKTDPEEKPVARISLKPWTNHKTGEMTIHPIPTTYGSNVEGFSATVHKWLEDNKFKNPKMPENRDFEINKKLYADVEHGLPSDHRHYEHPDFVHGGAFYSTPKEADWDDEDAENHMQYERENAQVDHNYFMRNIHEKDNDDLHQRIGHGDYEEHLGGYDGSDHRELLMHVFTDPIRRKDGEHPLSQRIFDSALDHFDDLDSDDQIDVNEHILKHHSHLLDNSRKSHKIDLDDFRTNHFDGDDSEHILSNKKLNFKNSGEHIEHILSGSESLTNGSSYDMEKYIHSIAHNADELREAHEKSYYVSGYNSHSSGGTKVDDIDENNLHKVFNNTPDEKKPKLIKDVIENSSNNRYNKVLPHIAENISKYNLNDDHITDLIDARHHTNLIENDTDGRLKEEHLNYIADLQGRQYGARQSITDKILNHPNATPRIAKHLYDRTKQTLGGIHNPDVEHDHSIQNITSHPLYKQHLDASKKVEF